MSLFNIPEFLENNGIAYKGPNRRGYIEILECLYCGSKNKLNVYTLKDDGKIPFGFSKCFKCGEPGSFFKIIATVKNIPEEAAFSIFRGDLKRKTEIESPFAIDIAPALEISAQRDKKEIEISKLPEVVMPLNLESLDEECIKYLNKRGLSVDDFKKIEGVYVPYDLKIVFNLIQTKYQDSILKLEEKGLIGVFKDLLFAREPFSINEEDYIKKFNEVDFDMFMVCHTTIRLRGRIVFPVKVGNRNLAFVARDMTGKSKVKAVNSSGPWSSSLFWNFNNVRNSDEVVICEGIFSAISCGINRSIALLGKNINDDSDKIRLIKRLKAKRFYIYLDTGADKEAKRLKKILMNFAEEVHIVRIPSAIKVQRFISEKELDDINLLGIKISPWTLDNTYLINFGDHRSFKMALRLINGEIIPKNDQIFLSRAHKIKKLGKDLVQTLASGDYLDSNDLGLEFNQELISNINFFNCN